MTNHSTKRSEVLRHTALVLKWATDTTMIDSRTTFNEHSVMFVYTKETKYME